MRRVNGRIDVVKLEIVHNQVVERDQSTNRCTQPPAGKVIHLVAGRNPLYGKDLISRPKFSVCNTLLALVTPGDEVSVPASRNRLVLIAAVACGLIRLRGGVRGGGGGGGGMGGDLLSGGGGVGGGVGGGGGFGGFGGGGGIGDMRGDRRGDR